MTSWVLLWTVVAMLGACSQPSPPAAGGAAADAPVEQTPRNQTLVMVIRDEPGSLTPKLRVGTTLSDAKRLFNAGLAIQDELQTARPYLTETLPQLNTDSWRVTPDGRMETIYRLRPNLSWHDGVPLTADDFVFAWQVYTNPGDLPLVTLTPQSLMDEVVAVDPQTVLIRWRQTYPEAGALKEDFPPLPRHILEGPFQSGPSDAFANHPYWTREYVGLGPYRLDRWDLGTSIEGVSFPGHALGRPRIDRIRLIFIPDANTIIANLLAGEAQMMLSGTSFSFQQARVLQQQWAPRNEGTVQFEPTSLKAAQFQFRPEYVQPRAILDLRVRQALAHSVDRQTLIDSEFEGEGLALDALVSRFTTYRDAADRAVTKYPYDPRRAEQLMNEAGYTRGADGFYAHPTEGRLSMELRASANAQYEKILLVMANGWQQLGIDATTNMYPVARLQDGQFRASFPSLQLDMGGLDEAVFRSRLHSGSIPRAENRWTGSNRGGWSSPESDRLVDQLDSTLDRSQRDQIVIQLAKFASEQLPILTIYYDFSLRAHTAALEGPILGGGTWNVHEWKWR
jgi:peptide/nickel transport system substrate-binding protein